MAIRKTDIAGCFARETGTWYMRYSSTGTMFSGQWGERGDVVVQGDFTTAMAGRTLPSSGRPLASGGSTEPAWDRSRSSGVVAAT
jgi:hypothetical protein